MLCTEDGSCTSCMYCCTTPAVPGFRCVNVSAAGRPAYVTLDVLPLCVCGKWHLAALAPLPGGHPHPLLTKITYCVYKSKSFSPITCKDTDYTIYWRVSACLCCGNIYADGESTIPTKTSRSATDYCVQCS